MLQIYCGTQYIAWCETTECYTSIVVPCVLFGVKQQNVTDPLWYPVYWCEARGYYGSIMVPCTLFCVKQQHVTDPLWYHVHCFV